MEPKKFSRFFTIWVGQFISMLGSGLSSFGLSVWIFYKTGSTTSYAMSFLCNILPGIIFAPFAGSFADRKNRKAIMMIADSLDALLKVVMAFLFFTDTMNVWMVYPIMFFSSTFSTFQSPAYSASIPMMVDEKMLSKANSLNQLSESIRGLITPLIAGILYPIIEMKGLLVIDFITFFAAFFTVLFTKIPQICAEKSESKGIMLFVSDMKAAWKLVLKKKGFVNVVLSFSLLNFLANASMILLAPLVLGTYSSSEYGIVETVFAASMVAGGLLSGIMPDTKNCISRVFLVLGFSGIGLVISGMNPSWMIIAVGMAVFSLFVPYANTLLNTAMQKMFSPSSLGRVGALLSALLMMVSPLASIVAGPLVDDCFEPLMSEDGVLGKSIVGNLIGSGQGRGIGLLFVLSGIILIILCMSMCIKYKRKPMDMSYVE